MGTTSDSVLIQWITFAGSVLSMVGLGAWRARGIQASLENKIDKEIKELRQEVRDRQDEGYHQMGEGLAALREKVTQTELWNRDTFVQKQDFQLALENVMRNLSEFRKDSKAELALINEKLDRNFQARQNSQPHR